MSAIPYCCLPSTARTHISWVTESPAPWPTTLWCQVSTTWTGTHALLKSGKEDIQWAPKHKGAPLKGCLPRQRQLLQSCHYHVSWQVNHKPLSHNMTYGYLTPRGPDCICKGKYTHRGKHLFELLRVLQLQVSVVAFPFGTRVYAGRRCTETQL